MAASLRAVRTLPEDSTSDIAEKKRRLAAAKSERQRWNWRVAADLYIAAFLLSKKDIPREPGAALVPTTDHVWRTLSGGQAYGPLVGAAREVADKARAFHWPLEFPDVMSAGGFDAVLGNPPWERIKLQEQEFFAAREPDIALAPTADARSKMIARLKLAADGTRERSLHHNFEQAKRTAEASSIFAREGGRFPLTGQGDINTYALFAELFGNVVNKLGRAGIIIPTGIATDATTAAFFGALVSDRRLVSLHDFQTGMGYFDRIGHARFKFALLTIGGAGTAPLDIPFSFFSRTIADFADGRRHYTLRATDIARINPNTKTSPIFRTRYDADLTAKIHSAVPAFFEDGKLEGNPWGVSFMRMFDMTNDSDLFNMERGPGQVPLMEGKMMHQFDHRWCTFEQGETRELTPSERADYSFEPNPRYWVEEVTVNERLAERKWSHSWLMGWRQNARTTDERTFIATIFPKGAVGNSVPLLLPKRDVRLCTALLACLNSLVNDFVVRQKVGGANISYHFVNQFPVIPPETYSALGIEFVTGRALERFTQAML